MAKHPPRRPFTTVQLAQGWRELIPGIEFKRLCVDEQAGTKSFLLRAWVGLCLFVFLFLGFVVCLVFVGVFCLCVFLLFVGVYHAAAAGTTHSRGLVRLAICAPPSPIIRASDAYNVYVFSQPHCHKTNIVVVYGRTSFTIYD